MKRLDLEQATMYGCLGLMALFALVIMFYIVMLVL